MHRHFGLTRVEALAIASAGTIIIASAIGYHHAFTECILNIQTLCLASYKKDISF